MRGVSAPSADPVSCSSLERSMQHARFSKNAVNSLQKCTKTSWRTCGPSNTILARVLDAAMLAEGRAASSLASASFAAVLAVAGSQPSARGGFNTQVDPPLTRFFEKSTSEKWFYIVNTRACFYNLKSACLQYSRMFTIRISCSKQI